MLDLTTPLTGARVAMVQDLYQMAFCRQLALGDRGADACGSTKPLSDAELASLLQDYAAVLAHTEHRADAVLLMGLAVQTAPRIRAR
jgi:hypothetical protein